MSAVAAPPEAATLSMPGLSETATRTAKQFITFTIGAEEFGIEIMLVREIKGWTDSTTLPKSPPSTRGVINLRGVIVPILDLRARFSMGITQPSRMHVVIIVIVGARITGLLVDTVSDIISVEQGLIREIPEMGTAAVQPFLEGLVALGDRLVTLVSLEGLLGTPGAGKPNARH